MLTLCHITHLAVCVGVTSMKRLYCVLTIILQIFKMSASSPQFIGNPAFKATQQQNTTANIKYCIVFCLTVKSFCILSWRCVLTCSPGYTLVFLQGGSGRVTANATCDALAQVSASVFTTTAVMVWTSHVRL